MERNLAKEKKELAENAHKETKRESIVNEDSLDRKEMSGKERRRYKRQQEQEKIKELSFWRKVQYILMYYTWKFVGILALCLVVAVVIYRIYIATRPVALDLVLVNDASNEVFKDELIALYDSCHDLPDDAVYLIDTNIIIQPDETYTSEDMAYYSKMLSDLSSESTQIVICDAKVVDYYAIDGYLLEMKNCLPEDLYTQLEAQGRLYECDGPVEDSDYYAVDITGMEFTKRTGIGLDHTYICIPTILSEENREIAYDFIRMVLDLENP